jgi:hypothetical protein
VSTEQLEKAGRSSVAAASADASRILKNILLVRDGKRNWRQSSGKGTRNGLQRCLFTPQLDHVGYADLEDQLIAEKLSPHFSSQAHPCSIAS